MTKHVFLALTGLLIFLSSCSDKYKLQLQTPKTIQISEPLRISVKEKNGNPIDSVQYFINGEQIQDADDLNISDYRLGKQAVSATIYFDDATISTKPLHDYVRQRIDGLTEP